MDLPGATCKDKCNESHCLNCFLHFVVINKGMKLMKKQLQEKHTGMHSYIHDRLRHILDKHMFREFSG
jgi:hypothetical protein